MAHASFDLGYESSSNGSLEITDDLRTAMDRLDELVADDAVSEGIYNTLARGLRSAFNEHNHSDSESEYDDESTVSAVAGTTIVVNIVTSPWSSMQWVILVTLSLTLIGVSIVT